MRETKKETTKGTKKETTKGTKKETTKGTTKGTKKETEIYPEFKHGYVVVFDYQENKRSPKYQVIAGLDKCTSKYVYTLCSMLTHRAKDGLVYIEPKKYDRSKIEDLRIEQPRERRMFMDTLYELGYGYDSFNGVLYNHDKDIV